MKIEKMSFLWKPVHGDPNGLTYLILNRAVHKLQVSKEGINEKIVYGLTTYNNHNN